jgi:hypothetical protein
MNLRLILSKSEFREGLDLSRSIAMDSISSSQGMKTGGVKHPVIKEKLQLEIEKAE